MKQRNVPKLGAIIDSLYTCLPILSIVNFLSIITVLYNDIKEQLLPWAPWLEFWHFVATANVAVVVMMVLIYKFVLPSLWTFRNKQMNSFESELVDEVRKLREEIQQLKETKPEEEKELAKVG